MKETEEGKVAEEKEEEKKVVEEYVCYSRNNH